MEETSSALGETLARVARGEISLATYADLGPDALAQVMELALRQLEIGKTTEAVRLFEGLVALDATNPLFHEYLGLALERARDLDRALEAYSANLEHLGRLADDGRLVEGYLLRARLRAMRGEVREATADLAHAKSHDRGLDPVLSAEVVRLERAIAGGVQ
jgi:tetratricopeptide (TPR) repeat protein